MAHLTKDEPGTHLMEHYLHIRTWESKGDGYKLELYDTHRTSRGKSVLAYQFFHDGTLIFEGDEYSPSPMHAIDGDQAVGGLLGFLSLRPGDTDSEYFERHDYTTEQLEWAKTNGEELSLLAEELEGLRV